MFVAFCTFSYAAHTLALASATCCSLYDGAAGAAGELCGIARNQAATAAPTATKVIKSITNTGHRAGLFRAMGPGGPHGPVGGNPGGNPAGPGADGCPVGGVSDMQRWYR